MSEQPGQSYAVLTKFGNVQNTLKTKQLYDAIKKGGVAIQNEDGLYRSLSRSHRFKKVGRGLWGLSEWYPAAPAKAKAPRSTATNVHSLSDDVGGDEFSEEDEIVEVDTA